jgi:RimJ/RimL family protein N-acetyltransferase
VRNAGFCYDLLKKSSTEFLMKNLESPPIITTERLVLRQWCSRDLEPFAGMNADPRVREYFPGLQTREESDHSVSRVLSHIEKCRHVLYRLECDEWKKEQRMP